MSGAETEVWSGGVNTWECDEMGHLNVRFWVAKSLEGLASLAAMLGMPRAFAGEAHTTLVVREQHMRFLREARAGAALSMTGGVVEMDETTARILLVIRHVNGDPAATFQLQVAHATSRELRPFPWSSRLRAAAEALKVEIPAYAAARGLTLDPVTPTASLERADALGLKRIGLGVLQAQECDVFGRMRGEMFMGRVSDGVGRLFSDLREQTANAGGAARRVGGAVLEYRVVHPAWPRAGDRLEVRSGLASCDRKTQRVFHWMVDPDSGRPWASSEAVVVSFDLDARKVVENTDEVQALFNARAIPGLGL